MAKRPRLRGRAMAAGPYSARDDGTIVAADGSIVCVLGAPEDDITLGDCANGAAILALPDLLAAARGLNADARPGNWDDDDDPKQVAAWRALDAALAKAEATIVTAEAP